jgi:hypothetical protein
VARAGRNPEICGAGARYVKPAAEAVPPLVVTVTLPLAPLPTTAVMRVSFSTVTSAAGTPPKLTCVALGLFALKLRPIIVTELSCGALCGEKLVITGAIGAVTVRVNVVVVMSAPSNTPIVTTAVPVTFGSGTRRTPRTVVLPEKRMFAFGSRS